MLRRDKFFWIILLVLLFALWLRIEDLNHYPVGINDDEAANLLDAHHFSQSGKLHFLIFDLNPRSEIVHRIVQGITVYFAGSFPFVIRLTGVMVSLISIAVAYWASQESLFLLYPNSRRAWRKIAALIAASFLVVAVGYFVLSRTSYRPMYQILFSLLLIGFLTRGVRLWQWRDFALSGIFLGLLPHTYTSAYLVPLAMISFSLVLAIREWFRWRVWLPRLLLVAGIASLLVLPILLRLSDAPEYRLRRTTDVRGTSIASAETLAKTFYELFFTEGYGHPSYNAASQPVVPVLFAVFVLLGILLLLWRIRHPLTWFLLPAFVLILIPLVLAGEPKHALRVSGVYAILAIVVAFGAYLGLSLGTRLFKQVRVQQGFVLLILLALGVNGLITRQIYRDYWDFAENYPLWRHFEIDMTHNEWLFRADRREFAEWLIRLDNPILLPADEIIEAPTRVWLLEAFPNVVTTARFFDLPDNTVFVMPYTIGYADLRTATQDYVLLMDDTVYILPPLTETSHEALLTQIEGAEALYRDGIIDFLGYYRTLPADFSLSYQVTNTVFPAVYNNQLAVINWYGQDTLPRNEASQLSLSLELTAEDSIWAWYSISVQMEAQDRSFVARETPAAWMRQQLLRWLYPTALWQVGDTVPYRVVLDVPPLETGAYRLTAGIFAIPNRELPADTDSSGNPTIGWIKVPPENIVSIPSSAASIGAIFENSIELSAVELLPQENGQVLLRLYWTSLVHRPDFDAFVFVHLYNDAGEIISQVDARPHDGNYPTLIWDEGEIVMTEYRLDVGGNDLSSLNLRMGMYIFPDGVNLQGLSLQLNSELVPDSILLLGKVADWIGE